MSILSRTAFYDNQKSVVRMWDWALVKTSLGMMAEPFMMNLRHVQDIDFANYDPEDIISRVDELVSLDVNKQQLVLSNGTDHLHGGSQTPRTGR